MGLSIEDLDTCSPDAVDAVAASWERLSAAMTGDEASVDRDVIGPLAGAWISDDGRRAVQLIGYVGDQLEAVRAESGAMAAILREAAQKLRTAQSTLRQALDDARRNGITRQPDGRLTWTAMSDAEQTNLQGIADDIAKRVTAALDQATAADELAAVTMKANVDFGPKRDFNVHSLGADPAADARRAADLLTKLQSGELSSQDIRELKLLGLDNAGNPGYQTQLVRDLGPQGLLDTAKYTTPPWSRRDADSGDLKVVQDTLRNALSAASPELARDKTWMEQLKQAGRNVVNDPGDPLSGNVTYGYQALDTLIRQGTYDTEFLKVVGRDVLDYDKELNARGIGWGTDQPSRDPVNGYLVALKNNPAAATEMFAGNQGKNDLDYLANQRELRNGIYGPGPGAKAHLDPLGDAIAAATRVGTDPTKLPSVVSNVVGVFSDKDSSALSHSEHLRTGVTQMLVSNPATLHAGLSNQHAGVSAANMPPGLPAVGVAREDMLRLVAGLAGDKLNVAALQQAEQAFTWSGLSAIAANPDGVYGSPQAVNPAMEKFAANSAEVFGAIDRVTSDDIRSSQLNGDKASNATLERWTRWGGGALSAAATVFAPAGHEWIGDVGAVVIDKSASEINDWLKQDSSGDASKQISRAYVDRLTMSTDTVLQWQNDYNSHLPPGRDPVDLVDVVDTGYNTGEQVTKGTRGTPG
ncbi:hypothetical protein GCM10023205_13920 [Yinghuangia aomiensis]|uniref:WXG100 family type VII secretion target n=1 Tax=Yinghuangia aomiensis TaxID=676205 RepID=A0ABP9GUU1_9ACTN